MEPQIPQQNFKSMATVLWIALITAIIVTIVDWKIKQDILRLTDAFYRVYPATMEAQHGVQKQETYTNASGHSNPPPVLRFPVVGSDSRMEAQNAPVSLRKNSEDHSQDWARFAPDIETGIQSGTAADSE